ncbi:pyridoxal phosphate-dependent decarboxylase family protein [Actinospica sp.]|uniref:pyridoxal phosphate-dependent decarboxylase family protein n=1 Tax=Actinospica sp. TaxID=1872142 RepID=UPI002BF2DCDF|nr:pyridoxal-dependent decarboxylase [Actinospica sp.]HWG27386.1 pyridoxal-dependent decarboxylase [Actinospica sp.]
MSDVQQFLESAARAASGHLTGLDEHPVWRPTPAGLRSELAEQPLPEAGADPGALLAEIERRVLAYPMGNGHPAFFGWVNAAPHPAGIAGALLAAAVNPSSAGGDHADIYLERAVVRWIADLAGFPHEQGAGLLTSGASMATIVAIGAARQRALAGAGWDVRERGLSGAPQLTAYATAEVHSCVGKAIELLGIGRASLRTVADDGFGHLDPAALREAIAADRAAGALPFLAVGSAGTVTTGAVDPLRDIAAACAESGLWFHVDGAYGAFGVLDPVIAERYAGMELADSVALDPHKWLQVPAGVGCLLVRDRAQLRETFSLVPPYLRDDSGDPLGWYSEYGIEQTRPFRALSVWAALAARGRSGIAADIAACTNAARELDEMVAKDADFELAAETEVSIVAFRYAPAGIDDAEADRITHGLAAAIQARGRVFVTDSLYRGRPVLRACLINPAVGEAELLLLLEEAREAAVELAEQGR